MKTSCSSPEVKHLCLCVLGFQRLGTKWYLQGQGTHLCLLEGNYCFEMGNIWAPCPWNVKHVRFKKGDGLCWQVWGTVVQWHLTKVLLGTHFCVVLQMWTSVRRMLMCVHHGGPARTHLAALCVCAKMALWWGHCKARWHVEVRYCSSF